MDLGLWTLGWILASATYSLYRRPKAAESVKPKA
jgi:hypothetical protein